MNHTITVLALLLAIMAASTVAMPPREIDRTVITQEITQ